MRSEVCRFVNKIRGTMERDLVCVSVCVCVCVYVGICVCVHMCTVASAPSPGVVEEATVPELVHAPGPGVEVAGVGAVEQVESVLRVLTGLTLHQLQQNTDAQST